MRTSKLWGFLATALAVCGALAPTAAAAEPAPAWQIHVYPYPTRFTPGTTGDSQNPPGYVVIAKNVGGAASSGKFTVVDQLSTGVVPSFKAKPQGDWGPEHASKFMTCGATAKTVTCNGTGPVQPGEQIRVIVFLEASSKAPASVVNTATIEGGGAAAASASIETKVGATPAPFGFLETDGSAFGTATGADGATVTQAGAHPFQLSVAMNFNDVPPQEVGDTIRVPGGGIRKIEADLPQGVVVNPNAVSKCTESQLEASNCPNSSQVGTITLQLSLSGGYPGFPVNPLYNMVTPPGVPAELGFEVIEGTYVHLLGKLRSDNRFRLAADVDSIPAKIGVMGAETSLWGNPSDEAHDFTRGICLDEGGTCTTDRNQGSFVTLPSSCGGPTITNLRIENWLGEKAATSYPSSDPAGNPVGVDGCNKLQFEPTIESRATTNLADSPTGLDFHLRVPQNGDFDGLATANLRNAKVTLPEGMVVNPPGAIGLDACSEDQIGLDSMAPPSCPDASKVGTVEVTTPLLDHPLPGSIYLAKPYDNPFGTLLGLYIAVEDPPTATGVVIKLAGRVDADPATGRLTASFDDNPELPFDDFHLSFFNGPRAALKTPLDCGEKTTVSTLTPWSAPEGADAHPSDSFATVASPAGACVGREAEAPNVPAFDAGTATPQAGAFSPFSLRVARADGTQGLTGIDATLPPGAVARLSGIPYCSEAQIAAAKAREAPNQGASEIASPSCPAASSVGTVKVGAGAGPTPLYVNGTAYMSGPYKGAPLSLVIITPAVAGPFDLGAVVVRTALYVDPESAQVHAVSDPLPTIREGVPLDVRSVEVDLSRPDFTLNPTSCDPMSVTGMLLAPTGSIAHAANPFQVGGCSALGFKPELSIRLKGGTRRSQFPALDAVVKYHPGEANIRRVSVALPRSEFLEQGHIGTVCTRVQFAAAACPKASVYGFAKAWTPLLADPLEGPVYMRSSSHELPDLVADLHGQINVVLAGRIDSLKGGIRTTFEGVPDAPVSRFALQMRGGKKGLLVNSRDICKGKNRAVVRIDGQNGKTYDSQPVLKTPGCKGSRSGGKHQKPAKR